MDGEAISIIATIVVGMISQTSLILYKIGQIEQSIKDLQRRLNKVEEKVF